MGTRKRKRTPNIRRPKKYYQPAEYTTSETLILTHYKLLEINKIWTPERIQRLLGYLRLTRDELAAMCNYERSSFKGQLGHGKLTGSVALLLTILEAQYLGDVVKDTIPNVFDFYGSSRHTETD